MNKIPATVGILTFNNEDTLRRTLESVREFDDVVICDGGSHDKTLDIAREYGARVIAQDTKYKNADGSLADYGGVRQRCLEAAKHDWFLYIDSDETISDGLCDDIRLIASKETTADSTLVYKVPIGIMMDGRYLKYSSNYPGYQYRFFNRKSGARFVKPVHERIVFDDAHVKIGVLAHPWYIYTTREYWRHYVRETGGYRPIEVARSCDEPFTFKGYFYHTLWWHLRASGAVIIKAARNYLLHGFKDAVPVCGELGRAAAPLITVWKVTVCRMRKALRSLL
ncbi:MAG TPA: glycosyltransferase [Candidatus Paceibacterota bacterium]